MIRPIKFEEQKFMWMKMTYILLALLFISCHTPRARQQYDQLSEKIRANELLIGHYDAFLKGSRSKSEAQIARYLRMRDSLEQEIHQEQIMQTRLEKQLSH